MSRRVADLLIKIGADSYQFHQTTKKVEAGLDGVSKKLTNIGKNLSLKLTAPLVALAGASVNLFDTQAKSEAKVQQAIKSTTGAAKLSFQQLTTFASELQGKTLFGDETILNNATAQLLTFTNIADSNFKRTQAVALDLSTVLDSDLKSASIQLGKALNDPVKNLSALSRSGIQFSKEQTEVIKKLAETGRLAEAQTVILDELERQYGGQAEAQAKVGAGALVQLKNSWGDFMEQVGAAIMPALNVLAKGLQSIVVWLQSLSPATKTVIVTVASLAAAVGPLLLTAGAFVKILPLIKTGLLALTSPMTGLIGLAVMLTAAFASAFSSYQNLQGANKSTAQQWVAEGTYKVGDEDKVKGYIAKFQADLAKSEEYYNGKLGSFWKDWNADYKKEVENASMMIGIYQEVLIELGRKKKAEEEATKSTTKAMQEAKKESDALLASMLQPKVDYSAITNPILILKKQIADLENQKLLPDTTEAQIQGINSQLAILNDRLQKVQNATVSTEREPIALTGISAPLMLSTVEVPLPIKVLPQVTLPNSEELGKVASSMASTLNKGIADIASSSLAGIGQMIGGADLGLNDLAMDFISQMSNFLTTMGAQLLSFGIAMVAFKEAFKELLAQPWLAIGVGAAMIIAGAAMQAAMQKNAKSNIPKLAKGGLAYGATYAMVGDNPNASIDPEVIAPLSKLQKMLPQTGPNNIQIDLKLKGRDLVGAYNKNTRFYNRVNG